MTDDLSVFRRVDFRSVRQLNEVWLDSPESDAALQKQVLLRFEDSLDGLLSAGDNQLGLILTGAGGSGKTHTLGQIRRKAMAAGAYFVLVDCTDILHFWPTLALQYLQSLHQPCVFSGGAARTQIEAILDSLIQTTSPRAPASLLNEISGMNRDQVVQLADDVVVRLKRAHRARMLRHGTVRALIYLYSGERSLGDLAYSYLQGQKLDSTPDPEPSPEVQAVYLGGENNPKAVVSDLAWLMSLSRPTVLAFDQLDPIVTQHRLLAAEENHQSQAIINGIVSGFLSLMETLARTLPVVAVLEASWQALHKWGLQTAADRFHLPAIPLDPPRDARSFEEIVRQRLERRYRAERFTPPYASWPFLPSFFAALAGETPRQVLNLCERHRQACVAAGKVFELGADRPADGDVEPPESGHDLDAAFTRLVSANLPLPNEDNEDQAGHELAGTCEVLLMELPTAPDVDYQVDREFRETKKYESLHVRLRRILHDQSGREEHVCLRVLEKTNFKAFEARLAAARTMSGVAEGLPGRTLVILRNAAQHTPAVRKLIDDFSRSGGRIEPLTSRDLAVFAAVRQLQRESPGNFETWLRRKRPLSQTALFRNILPAWLQTSPPAPPRRTPDPAAQPPAVPHAEPAPSPSAAAILVGLRDGVLSQPVEFPLIDITRHVVIRAGSGGGKTVLLKRLVEEAALAGVSSIVIDSARDLSFLGDAWPAPPEGWLPEDAGRAQRYLRDVQVRIWTPGRPDGRPVFLSPVPDFRNGFEDRFEFDQAVQIATDSLGALLIGGRNRTQAMAVLQAAVKYFALQQGHDLPALANVLQDLPDSATPNISRARKLAREMGDQLNALMLRDPMLSPASEPLDLGTLFGAAGRPIVSVISLFALNDISSQASFVGRLAMAVFDWIRRNPARDGLRGLFVLDEAAPFLPRNTSESKPALMLLSQQARKYGVGLLLATQNPMDLDYNATAQFATQFFGTANQPQVVQYIGKVMEQKGLNNLNPAGLKAGSFYVAAPSLRQPVRVQAPMCLSWHPRNRTPTDEEILERVLSLTPTPPAPSSKASPS